VQVQEALYLEELSSYEVDVGVRATKITKETQALFRCKADLKAKVEGTIR
jgi:hypothetical protein